MKTERIMSILRATLTIIGGFLVGRNLYGLSINEHLWQEVLGSILASVGIVMSIIDKTATLEKVEGAARQVLSFAGSFLVAKNILSAESFATILAGTIALLPLLLGKTATSKTQDLDSGKLSIDDLKK